MASRISTATEPRYLRYREICNLYCVGRTKARNMCEAAGAVSKVGKVVLIDRNKLDAYIASLTVNSQEEE